MCVCVCVSVCVCDCLEYVTFSHPGFGIIALVLKSNEKLLGDLKGGVSDFFLTQKR